MKREQILKTLSFGAVAAVIVLMMAATVLEKLQGTPAALQAVYHNPLFIALWAVAAVAGLAYLLTRGAQKRPFTFLLHCALVVILCGALVTHLFGVQGEIHLREGEALSSFELEDGSSAGLPFSIRLDSFEIEYHTGSRMPSDYRSEVTFMGHSGQSSLSGLDPEPHAVVISMNNIAKYRGYRFYQADYDEDGAGSILAVSHDPLGVGITYAGYLLLLISMIGFFFQRDTQFRASLRRVMSWTACFVVFLTLPQIPASAGTREVGRALGELYVYYGHRVCPFDTYLQEKGLDGTLSSLGRMKLFPVADASGSVSWYAAEDKLPEAVLEDEGLWNFIRKSPELVLQDLEEGSEADALQILAGIRAYQEKTAASVLPSASHVRAERMYIRIARPRVQFMFCLAVGLFLFVLTVIRMSKGKPMPSRLLTAGMLVALLMWIYLTVTIGLRWYVSGTGPWVGRYSVMMLMAWFATLAVVLLVRKMPLVGPLGFLLAGFTMLLASRESVSPQIMPLMPVLQSPLLSIHVLSMMMSYTLFGLVAFNGVMGLCVRKESSVRLLDVSLVVLYPAVFLLTFGTFLGAVWANISWGSYWAWDPKETWALVTMLVYSFTLHGGALKAFRNPRFFHAYTILAFLAVLITYFGVNLLLGGMHSYGA
ncbi:MAG: cytochrome c biogenesis protein CcsA [Bacteroidales bacterium]|nr:cytochrome c biogenesis protein CcsA [Bacteroidales bacterium]